MTGPQLGVRQVKAAVVKGVQGTHEPTKQGRLATPTSPRQNYELLPFNGIGHPGQDLFMPFSHVEVFSGDGPVMIVRLVHHGYLLLCGGPSYRIANALMRQNALGIQEVGMT